MRLLLVLALSLFSYSAYSDWRVDSGHTNSNNCKTKGINSVNTTWGTYEKVSAYRCDASQRHDGVWIYTLYLFYSSVSDPTPCPGGSWNQSTFQCDMPPEPDPCEDKQGDITGFMTSNSYLGCIGGCAVSQTGVAIRLNDGTISSRYQYSGSSCSGDGGGGGGDDPEPPSAPDDSSATPEPEIPPTKEAEDTKTDPDTGETTSTTETSKDYQTDNNGQIGDVNETTKTTTTTHSDGSTTTTTTNTRTETTGGVKTSSTTETRVTCDAQQNCTTNITGTGNSTEQVPGGEDGEEGKVSGGESCDSPPQCDGDALQCAVILQTYKLRCDGAGDEHDWSLPEDSETLSFENSMNEFSDRVRNSAMIDGVSDFLSIGSGGGCPTWSVTAWVFDITFDQFCSPHIPWDIIWGVIVAVACLAGFRIAFQ